jgi:hypothetical protein
MTKLKVFTVAVVVALGAPVALAACGKKDEAPPTTPSNAPGSAWGQPGYGQPPPPGYGTAPPSTPVATSQPTVAPAPGQLATPGPAALPCTNDTMCVTHKCNTQYGKCAFPCESDNDCIQGSYCAKVLVPSCWPKAPGQQ